MAVKEIKKGIYYVGALHWDRELFDNLVPIPDGTTYNSYLVKGSEKTALIDTVDPDKEQVLFNNLKQLNVDRIDYVVSQHAEQDHSGTIPKVLSIFPEAKVVTNQKCKGFLMDLLPVPEDKFIVIDDGETLNLGDKTLEFVFTPWVHWPETMCTYVKEDKILFTCDFFGSHFAGSNPFVTDEEKTIEDAKRYYAEIMMPFRVFIRKNLDKIAKFDIKMIAASHGSIYKKPETIINVYRNWVSDDVRNEVVLPYMSMHGSTEKMVNYLVDALIDRNITVKPFNVITADVGELAMALVDAATVVFGTPTVLAGPHPTIVSTAYFANAVRPKTKFASVIGSYGWGGRTVDILKGLLPNVKAEFIDPVLVKGDPGEECYKKLDELANKILSKHKELNII